jgi:SAM-dependent methyltransferase
VAGSANRPTAYRERILDTVETLLSPLIPLNSALDFGAGDGWFAHQIEWRGLARKVTSIDVRRWPGGDTPSVVFDGERLPFPDRTFDLTYAIDVLHHCQQPERILEEVLRCTSLYFLMKDHTYKDLFGWGMLCMLDEIGNRRFGVPSIYQYQRNWSWSAHIESHGFELQQLIYPARCHNRVLGFVTNHLQFLSLWRRKPR